MNEKYLEIEKKLKPLGIKMGEVCVLSCSNRELPNIIVAKTCCEKAYGNAGDGKVIPWSSTLDRVKFISYKWNMRVDGYSFSCSSNTDKTGLLMKLFNIEINAEGSTIR